MTVDWGLQRRWSEVSVGDEISPLRFPLSVHRLVVQAGANKDFAPIHHNAEIARRQGAPDMYANNVFLQGMWERAVREYIGLDGVIRKIGPFRMRSFTLVGETVVVSGRVAEKWVDGGDHLLRIDMRSTVSTGDTVVGSVTVGLPA